MIIILNDEDERWEIISHGNIKYNMYRISTYGRLSNNFTNKILKPHIDKDGYERIELVTYDGGKKFYIHRLVAFHYVDGYEEGLLVNHKDSIRNHNFYKNLEWVNPQGNTDHGMTHGFIKPHYGVTNKYDKKFIIKICELLELGYSTKDIIKELGFDYVGNRRLMKSLIVDIRSMKSHKDISKNYNFQYKVQRLSKAEHGKK